LGFAPNVRNMLGVLVYDAGGNQLTVRDPNSVGADMVYDLLAITTMEVA
jgi:hypothetical protein